MIRKEAKATATRNRCKTLAEVRALRDHMARKSELRDRQLNEGHFRGFFSALQWVLGDLHVARQADPEGLGNFNDPRDKDDTLICQDKGTCPFSKECDGRWDSIDPPTGLNCHDALKRNFARVPAGAFPLGEHRVRSVHESSDRGRKKIVGFWVVNKHYDVFGDECVKEFVCCLECLGAYKCDGLRAIREGDVQNDDELTRVAICACVKCGKSVGWEPTEERTPPTTPADPRERA